MKIIHKPKPDIGEHRKREGFLWFPKRIGNITKWLEWASWDEIYSEWGGYDDIPHHSWEGWCWYG